MIEIHAPRFDDLDFPKFKNDFWLPISRPPPLTETIVTI
jgi:hypothetical protein